MKKENLICPLCQAEIRMKINSHTGNAIEFYLEKKDSLTNDILTLLHKYWQWKAEGERPYYRNSKDNEKEREQYYYDNLNGDSIKYLPDEKAYEFNIQTIDSPEGDHWIRGKFKYLSWTGEGSDRRVETILILEKESFSY